ncbi:2-(1,2-epoxy-1,2-dihydrophenyl)acetyl-CoA isomerase [Vicingus serpentipes]|uniref:2-(1,2-epoxy-1,2-dihydrophenyl)acetyl-CoA isomerase n=1 Tax=Vicingus serpentipes TaxID=1926625 RepID=A0A5C6RZF1_9FLAO|nr:enoyl-CoA hydratase-related protein [Vicingus serpentipes]TXB67149.1 2-(1,2-epoxy-1,2-dihydrophenyl)acetyl-CoA isomerase [Vicingus serpentipes]
MSNIDFKIESGVGVITLNRPDKFNSFVRQMAFDLQKALDDCELNKEVRAIYITGVGKAFCAGQDLAEAIDPSQTELTKIVEEHYNPIIERLRNIEKPIVCGVNGVAAGAGANIALACDITVAGKSVAFIQAFSKIGLIPDSGGTFYLPRLIGMQKSAALMFLGDKVMAEEAEKMGMIYKVVEDEALQEEGMKLARKLAQMPTKGIGLTKRLLNESYNNTLTQQLALENELQNIAGKSYDYNEGVNAFLEKRAPIFKGE